MSSEPLTDFDVPAAKRAVEEGRVIELKSNEARRNFGSRQPPLLTRLQELEDLLVAVEDGELPGDCLMVEGYASWCRHCMKAKPVYEGLAAADGVKGKMVIARIDAAEAGIATIGGQDIHGYPSFVFLEKVDYKFDTEEYLGDRTVDGLKEYIAENCGIDRRAPAKEKTASEAAARGATIDIEEAKAAVEVIELGSAADLEALIAAQEEGRLPGDAMFVEAYWTECGHCNKFAPEYEDYAREVAGKIPVARINSVEHQIGELAGYPIDGVPYVVFLTKKTPDVIDNKYDAERFDDMRTADALRDFADIRLEGLRSGGAKEEDEGEKEEEGGAALAEGVAEASFAAAGHEADFCRGGEEEGAAAEEESAWLEM